MRLAFMGSPAFSVPALRALVAAGHEVACVYAQPPRPAGRGQRETPCPVHQAAVEMGLPVRTPARVRREAAEHEAFAALLLDAAVVVAYGLILPRPMLEAPRMGCLNIHASLLPRWRGAAPIQAAVLAGDAETGITIMRMDEGLDTGPMLLREATPVGPRETAAGVHDRLSEMGARLVLRALAERPPETPQPAEGATYAPKLGKEDGRLDWAEPAAALDRRVRAMTPWPGAFTALGGEVLRVLSAEPAEGLAGRAPGTVLDEGLLVACGGGTALRLTRVQKAGRAAMEAGAFLRGHAVPAGTVLG
ncbi:methionyl-tRNA formyltransferase [Roseomonas nepalensis]|uniref:Methionyl-tRNA formyltransferase n=1 Tax=Muricoccus nepalensis TaxID=1854500 RepID=A0A502GAI1_9PROT|nr:methionyl-tRNA formyltransferase [Roseomonas nepalensis]TPG58662.1 methionyl-tRNA formyltransferase [Roseomonas nepalensis]